MDRNQGNGCRRWRLCAAVMTLLFIACWIRPEESCGKIVYSARGDHNYRPYEFNDTDGNPAGFNVEVLRAAAKAARIDISINLGPWSEVRSQLQNGEIDILTGMFYSKSRDELVDFSIPHIIVSHSIFVRKGSPIQSLSDIRNTEIVVQKGDIMHDWALENRISDHIIAVENQQEALRLVSRGKHDCALAAKLQGLLTREQLNLDNIVAVGSSIEPEKYCFAVREGQTDLLEKLDTGLLEIQASGEYSRIYSKWFSGFEKGMMAKTIIRISLAIILIVSGVLALSFFWNRTLKRRVAEKTGLLTRELSERKKAEQALKESERRFHDLARLLPQIVFETDQSGNITFSNREGRRVLGYTQEDIERNPALLNYVAKENREFAGRQMEKVVNGEDDGVNNNEYRLLRKNGTMLLVNVYIVPVMENGVITGMLGIATDITHKRRAEQDRLRSERRAAEREKHALVGQVAGKMAHDFNNILGVVIGHAELSLLKCADEDLSKSLGIILEQAEKGRNFTKNLVAFAKDQEPRQELFQITKKLDLVLELMKKELEGIRVEKDFSGDIPYVLADPGMIEHAFMNLIQNAVHAMSLEEAPLLLLRGYAKEEHVFVEIEDNGCGIPDDHVNRIFSPSFTLKGKKDTEGAYQKSIKGTGYGMANVKKYVEKQNGSVRVDTAPGKGTVFTVSLPVTRMESTETETAQVPKDTEYSGGQKKRSYPA